MCPLGNPFLFTCMIASALQSSAPAQAAVLQAGASAASALPQPTQAPEIYRTDVGTIGSLSLSPDGTWLAAGGKDHVVVWEMETGRELHTLPGKEVAFSPDGRLLATCRPESGIKLWEPKSGVEVRTLADSLGSSRMVFSPDGQYVAASSEAYARVWEVSTGRQLLRFRPDKTEGYWRLGFSLDGRLLASAGYLGATIWEIPAGKQAKALQGLRGRIEGFGFSPDGRWLASGAADGTVRFSEIPSGRQVQALRSHDEGLSTVVLSLDGHSLATVGGNGILLWDTATRTVRHRLGQHGGKIAFSPDGKRLAATVDSTRISVWDVESGRELVNFDAHMGEPGIEMLRFLADGQRLVSAGRSLKLWETAHWRLQRAWMPPSAWQIAISAIERTPEPPAGYIVESAGPAEEYLRVLIELKNATKSPREFRETRIVDPQTGDSSSGQIVWEGKATLDELIKTARELHKKADGGDVEMHSTGTSVRIWCGAHCRWWIEKQARARGGALSADQVKGLRIDVADEAIKGTFEGFHLTEYPVVAVEPGAQVRFTLVFRVKKDTKLEQRRFAIEGELPVALKMADPK